GRRKKEPAALAIGEELYGEPGDPVRLVEPTELPRRDVQLVEAVRNVGVVLQVAVVARTAGPPAAVEAGVRVRERAEQELPQLATSLDELGPSEAATRLRERRQRQAVPGRDRLVVAGRLETTLALLQEASPEILVELAAQDRAAVLERLEQLGRDALVGRPREGQPLDAFGVCVLRRGEAALRKPQLAQHVVDGRLGDL